MTIRLPFCSTRPYPSGTMPSLPPGAQAPTQGALLMVSAWSWFTSSPPKQVQPWPGVSASFWKACCRSSGPIRKKIAWCTTAGFSGRNWVPVR